MIDIDLEDLDSSSLKKLLEMVHKFTGISMEMHKKTLLQGRLRPRMRHLGFSSYNQYVEYLTNHQSEIQEFINSVTTNETTFFRTQRVWEYFTEEFLPHWTKQNPNQTIKIWSGAASTGEEVYTIAICCEEYRAKNPGFNYQITGTDISSDVLALASAGEYSGRTAELFKGTHRALFDKYLKVSNGVYRVDSELRSRVKFALHNLFHVPADGPTYDIVFLRNVLIYFKENDQKTVLSNVSKGLVDQGVLIIGESESLGSLKTSFNYLRPLIYQKDGGKV